MLYVQTMFVCLSVTDDLASANKSLVRFQLNSARKLYTRGCRSTTCFVKPAQRKAFFTSETAFLSVLSTLTDLGEIWYTTATEKGLLPSSDNSFAVNNNNNNNNNNKCCRVVHVFNEHRRTEGQLFLPAQTPITFPRAP